MPKEISHATNADQVEEASFDVHEIDALPRAFDCIEVQYTLADGTKVWWPAKVTQLTIRDGASEVKAEGTVTFVAAHRMKECEQQVMFLANRAVYTRDGKTPWRSTMEAADVGEGDDGDMEWDSNKRKPRARGRGDLRRREKSRKTRSTASPRTPTQITPRTTTVANAQHEERNRRQSTLSRDTGSIGHTAALGTVHNEFMTSSDSPPVQDATRPAVARRPGSTTTTRPQTTRTRHDPSLSVQGGQNISPDMFENLQQRVARLEVRLAFEIDSREEKAVQTVVDEKQFTWRTILLQTLNRPIRRTKSTRVDPFGSAVQHREVIATELCDYKTFLMAVKHVAKTLQSADQNTVHFNPPLEQLRSSRLQTEATIIFSNGSDMLNWLGVCGDALRKDVLLRQQNDRRNTAYRVLGGIQYDPQDHTVPLLVFPGRSTSREGYRAQLRDQSERYRAVQLQPSTWDESNEAFSNAPTMTVGNSGMLHSTNPSVSATLFRITWRATEFAMPRSATRRGLRTGNVQPGDVSVVVPSVVFFGEGMCRQIKDIITEEEVASWIQ